VDGNVAWRGACSTDYPSLQNSPSRSNWTRGDPSADQRGCRCSGYGRVPRHSFRLCCHQYGNDRRNKDREIGTAAAARCPSSSQQRMGEQRANSTDFEADWDQPIKQQPTEYLRATARPPVLKAEVTTPRVRQYLRELIDECERLAGKADEADPRLR
jgi:hypothetical protein